MTDEPIPGLEEILAELTVQKERLAEMEASYNATIDTLNKENEELKTINQGLQREIIKNATGPSAPPEKTPEELAEEARAAFVEKVSKNTLELLK